MRQRPARPASPPLGATAQPGRSAVSRRAMLTGTALAAAGVGVAARPALAHAALAPAGAVPGAGGHRLHEPPVREGRRSVN